MSSQAIQGRQLHSPCCDPVSTGGFISSWDFGVSFAMSPQQVCGYCRQRSWQCSRARLSTGIGVGDTTGSGMGDREKNSLR